MVKRFAQEVVVFEEDGERVEDALQQPHGQKGTSDVL
jgi:hypothetical protein